jgi:hypothetical protein
MKDDLNVKSFGVKFDFSGTRTIQWNGKVERKLQTFFGRIRSMLNGSGLKGEQRGKIWKEGTMTTIYLSNKSPYKLLFGCKLKLNSILKTFGEIGILTTKNKIQDKLRNRGSTCMFPTYIDNHSRDVLAC